MNNQTVAWALLIALGSLASEVRAETARCIPFQGRITDAAGGPLPDGPRVIQFQIFGESAGGNALWAGEVHRATLNGGMVNVQLGAKNPLPVDRPDDPTRSFFDATLYLQITVDANADGKIDRADPPLLPRQAIIPVLFARESANSRLLSGYDWRPLFGTNDPQSGTLLDSKIRDGSISRAKLHADAFGPIPVGALLPFAGAEAPTNFLFCGGQEVSRTDYAALFTAIGVRYGAGDGVTTFNVPDLRGRTAAGRDDMGGNAARRMTSSDVGNPGIDGVVLGAAGGSDRVGLTAGQMPLHNHTGRTGSMTRNATHTHAETADASVGGGGGFRVGRTTDGGITTTTSSTGPSNTDHDHVIPFAGGSEAHPNVQPTIILNYIIRY
ncbi:MAG: tail fiber protein [Verrucomicrobia bacterium]|nr:tail fiber protein [Verrucomicrobiota bacterium]MBI3869345.1 tail fiber protein [Verrucomicrobiota bacterium]